MSKLAFAAVATMPSLAVPTIAMASGMPEITALAIQRGGGGQIDLRLTRLPSGAVVAVTERCDFRALSARDSARTRVEITGEAGADAMAIFEGRALFATRVSLGTPPPSGSWLSLVITYTVSDGPPASTVRAVQAVPNPLIEIDGRVSGVLEQVEASARQASASVCAARL